MEVSVKYADFNEVIKEVEIQVNPTQRKVFKITKDDLLKDVIEIQVIDDVSGIDNIVSTQTLNKAEIIDMVQVLQKFQNQI